jgi:hypothetical protein
MIPLGLDESLRDWMIWMTWMIWRRLGARKCLVSGVEGMISRRGAEAQRRPSVKSVDKD